MTAVIGISTFVAIAAQAQGPSTKGLMKGKVKPGLYEQKITLETTGLGVSPGQGKSTETTTQCLTAEDIETEEFTMDEGCTVKNVQRSATGAQITASCKDGALSEISITSVPNGFRVDMKTSGKDPAGKPFVVTMRSDAKYAGACKD